MENKVFYMLRAEGIEDECGHSWITEPMYPFGIFPDLTVSSIEVTPDKIREGCTPIDAAYTISNTGSYSADSFRVSIWIETTFINAVACTRHYAGLDAASELRDSMTVLLPPETDCGDGNWVRVKIDDLEQVTELYEWNNKRSFNLNSFTPKSISIADVPDDNGGMVEFAFDRSSLDQAGLDNPIAGYEVLRRIDPLPVGGEWSPGEGGGIVPGEVPRTVFPVSDVPQPGVWEVVGWVPAERAPTVNTPHFSQCRRRRSNAVNVHMPIGITRSNQERRTVTASSTMTAAGAACFSRRTPSRYRRRR